MLPRLKTRRQFLHVAGAGRKWVAPGLILQVCPHDADNGAPQKTAELRVGFTVSRKVGGAVVRNRARRRLRQAAERVMADQAADGRDYVLIGRRTTIERPFEDLVADLETALARLGARCDTRDDTGPGTGSDTTERMANPT
jgi:ribonuclease P protein component